MNPARILAAAKAKLAATQAKAKFKAAKATASTLSAEIKPASTLMSKLSNPPFQPREVLLTRIAELESQLAAKPGSTATAPAPTAAAKPTPAAPAASVAKPAASTAPSVQPGTITAAAFAADHGAPRMTLAEFNKLTPPLKSRFATSGGRIID